MFFLNGNFKELRNNSSLKKESAGNFLIAVKKEMLYCCFFKLYVSPVVQAKRMAKEFGGRLYAAGTWQKEKKLSIIWCPNESYLDEFGRSNPGTSKDIMERDILLFLQK